MIQHCKEKEFYFIYFIIIQKQYMHALLIGPRADGGVLFYYYY